MIRMNSPFAGLFAAAALLCQAQDARFERAKAAFERALKEPSATQKIALLQESIRVAPTFEAYYALGNTQFAEKQFGQASDSYKKAVDMANGEAPLAAGYFKLGLTSEAQGQSLEGIALLENSLRLAPDRAVAAELKRMRLAAAGKVQSAAGIARALDTGKAAGGSAKVDLQVNFEFNSAELTSSGRSQADELGKLLAQKSYPGAQFVFVGHTDLKGGESYNLDLSRRRADTVVRYLLERFSIASNRVRAEGRGQKEPLYPEVSDTSDRLNRRVEVRLASAK